MLADVASLAPLHRGKMESFWSGEALKCLKLLTDACITPKRVAAHALPVQSASAEEAVRHQYPSASEMTHRLSGY